MSKEKPLFTSVHSTLGRSVAVELEQMTRSSKVSKQKEAVT